MRTFFLLLFPALLFEIGGSAPAALAATFDAGAPLLQLEARGRETDTLIIPFCGVACVGRNPTDVTHQVTVGVDGMVTAVRTWNRLEDLEGTRSEVVSGLGRRETFRALRERLAAARIGFATGGCRLVLSRQWTVQGTNGSTASIFDAHMTWFGRGNRTNVLEFLADSEVACPAELGNLVETVLRYRDQAAAAP